MEHISFTKEAGQRFKNPWTAVFVGYFFILISAGGVSIFITLLDTWKSCESDSYKIAESLGTFFIAIIATAIVDLSLCSGIKNRKSFNIWSYLAGGFAIFLFWVTYQCKNNLSFFPSIIGTCLALFLWVIANADNDKIIYEENYADSVKKIERELTKPQPDDEFKS